MKKSTKKGIAVAALIIAALAAYHKFGRPLMMKKMAKSDVLKPKEFSTKPDASGNSTKFWFDGTKYWKQPEGPSVKSIAVETTEADFSQQYAN